MHDAMAQNGVLDFPIELTERAALRAIMQSGGTIYDLSRAEALNLDVLKPKNSDHRDAGAVRQAASELGFTGQRRVSTYPVRLALLSPPVATHRADEHREPPQDQGPFLAACL